MRVLRLGNPLFSLWEVAWGRVRLTRRFALHFPICLSSIRFVICAGRAISIRLLNRPKVTRSFEYVADDLPHLFAATDFVVSRAGATALFELLSLQKPALLIPLSLQASRGDQIDNARAFRNAGYSLVLSEEGLTPDVLCKAIRDLCDQSDALRQSMSDWHGRDAVVEILSILADCLNKN